MALSINVKVFNWGGDVRNKLFWIYYEDTTCPSELTWILLVFVWHKIKMGHVLWTLSASIPTSSQLNNFVHFYVSTVCLKMRNLITSSLNTHSQSRFLCSFLSLCRRRWISWARMGLGGASSYLRIHLFLFRTNNYKNDIAWPASFLDKLAKRFGKSDLIRSNHDLIVF